MTHNQPHSVIRPRDSVRVRRFFVCPDCCAYHYRAKHRNARCIRCIDQPRLIPLSLEFERPYVPNTVYCPACGVLRLARDRVRCNCYKPGNTKLQHLSEEMWNIAMFHATHD